jgi:hypothetical protein
VKLKEQLQVCCPPNNSPTIHPTAAISTIQVGPKNGQLGLLLIGTGYLQWLLRACINFNCDCPLMYLVAPKSIFVRQRTCAQIATSKASCLSTRPAASLLPIYFSSHNFVLQQMKTTPTTLWNLPSYRRPIASEVCCALFRMYCFHRAASSSSACGWVNSLHRLARCSGVMHGLV